VIPEIGVILAAIIKQLVAFFIAATFFGGVAQGADHDFLSKQDVIARIIKDSIQRCDPQTQYHSVDPYGARLASALKTSGKEPLRNLLENKITVCLDQRLSHQNTGAWYELNHNPLYAGYYSRNGHKVLTLWDNGKAEASNIIYGFIDALRGELNNTQSDQAIDGIFEKSLEKKGNLSPLFAVLSSPLGKFFEGRDKRLYAYWTPSSDLKEEMDANPSLITPPIRECLQPNSPPICKR
jgi:hypothetical protein